MTTSVGASVGSNERPVGRHPAPGVEQDPQRLPRDRAGRRRATVSDGRSASAVPAPTTTACDSARSRCASARASGPVIHCDVPSAAAVRPSRLIAVLSSANARPVRRWCRYGASDARPRRRPTPTSTSMPAARSRAMPAPATRGSGSSSATTTAGDAGVDQRLGARRRVAVVVARLERRRRRWRRGPRRRPSRSAATSACGPPGRRRWRPDPTISPSRDDDAADPGVRRRCGAGRARRAAPPGPSAPRRAPCTLVAPPAHGARAHGTARHAAARGRPSCALSHPDSHRRPEESHSHRSTTGWRPWVRGLPPESIGGSPPVGTCTHTPRACLFSLTGKSRIPARTDGQSVGTRSLTSVRDRLAHPSLPAPEFACCARVVRSLARDLGSSLAPVAASRSCTTRRSRCSTDARVTLDWTSPPRLPCIGAAALLTRAAGDIDRASARCRR